MGKLSWFPKYVLGPALAAALGFWVVGPRLAGSKKFQNLMKEKASQMASASEEKAPETATSEPEPQVTVGVKPVEETPRGSRRRRDR